MTLQDLLAAMVDTINNNHQGLDVCMSDIDTLQSTVANIYNAIYPIGSIYMTTNTTSPAQLFGGTWEKIEDKFLIGASDNTLVNSTGGEAAHTLTESEMASHTHAPNTKVLNTEENKTFEFQIARDLNSKSTARYLVAKGSDYWVIGADPAATDFYNKYDVDVATATAPTGGSQPHNNIPPYFAVYIWKRVE